MDKELIYKDWLKTQIKYDSKQRCAVPGCNEPGLYEGGDIRCWFPQCEKHSGLKEYFNKYIYTKLLRRENIERKLTEVLNGTN